MKKELIPTAIASGVLAMVMSAGALAAGLNAQQPHVLYGFNGPQFGQNTAAAVAGSAAAESAPFRHESGPLYGFNGPRGEANAPDAIPTGNESVTPGYRQVSEPLYGINGPRFGREVPGWVDK